MESRCRVTPSLSGCGRGLPMSTAARLEPSSRPAGAARSRLDTSMRNSGIEDLKAVLRRSAVPIVAAVLIGVVAMNVISQAKGPDYRASARVVLNSSDLSSAALGISPPYRDPSRIDQAEQNLVDSPDLYVYAAARAGGGPTAAAGLSNAVSGSVANNVVEFKASAGKADDAVKSVNAVATAYPSWRAQVNGRSIDAAIQQIRSREASDGTTAELDRQLQQLQVLKTLNAGETLFVDQAKSAAKTTPRPVRDSVLGAAIGLLIALLIIGARELFDTTVRSEADVEDALNAPVLATIESLPRRMRASVVGAAGGRYNDEYELLAANVAHFFDGHKGTIQLAITSADPGEGKTTTASNLAAALSRRGASVVLADFDLRKPSISEFVGIPAAAFGVSELLAGTADVRSALWWVQPNGGAPHPNGGQAVRVPSRERSVERAVEGSGSLAVLPGGTALRGDTGPRFAKLPALLEQLPATLDYVIVDTPPALLVAGMADLAQ